MGKLSENCRRIAQQAAEIRAGSAAEKLREAYGERRRDFLEHAMNMVDQSAYDYTENLQETTISLIAKQLYSPAADKGDAEARYRLGRLLADERFTGRMGLRDDRVAVEWLLKAAEQGHAQARVDLRRVLDRMYADGRIGLIGLNSHEAALQTLDLCDRAVNAEVRSPELLFTVARLYEKDELIDSTGEERAAFMKTCYAEAAEEGHPKAQRKLGLLLLPDTPGNKDAVAAAAKYLRMAAKQGDRKALCHLGKMYRDEHMERAKGLADQNTAVDDFKHAADDGLAEGKYRLAIVYLKGRANLPAGSKEIDGKIAEQALRDEAKRLLARAKEQGHVRAKLKYGGILLAEAKASSSADNQTEAIKAFALIDSVANDGDADLQHNEAILYLNSRSSSQTKDWNRTVTEKAMNWLRMSAKQGNPKAKATLERWSNDTKSDS